MKVRHQGVEEIYAQGERETVVVGVGSGERVGEVLHIVLSAVDLVNGLQGQVGRPQAQLQMV